MAEHRLRQEHRREVEKACGALAGELRTLVDGLGISQNRLAQRLNVNRGTLSKYLTVQQVPDWYLVLGIFEQVARERGQEVTEETWGRIRDVHRNALRLKHPRAFEVHVVRDELASVEREIHSLALREQALVSQIHIQEEQFTRLLADRHQLAADNVADREETRRERRALAEEVEHLQAEYEAQEELLRELKRDLELTRAEKAAADELCQELDRRLTQAEERAGSEEENRVRPELQDPVLRRLFLGKGWRHRTAEGAIEYLTGGYRIHSAIPNDLVENLSSALSPDETADLLILLDGHCSPDGPCSELFHHVASTSISLRDQPFSGPFDYGAYNGQSREVIRVLLRMGADRTAGRVGMVLASYLSHPGVPPKDPNAAIELVLNWVPSWEKDKD
ncbi:MULTISPECIES: hypothetical protein [unclassified Streptomyces]|uniref:hypothetical protein n=1 Tax=Streptomyces sp. NPDC017949 TaxID=3365020 RepID=UPI0037A351F2